MIQSKLKQLDEEFSLCQNKEQIYQKIMSFGQKLSLFQSEWKVEDNQVLGCQSLMYLYTEYKEGKLFFYADSDALISKGLAAILIFLYSGQTPEEILKSEPTIFQELGIIEILTPGRANGLSSLYIRIKKEALKSVNQAKLAKDLNCEDKCGINHH